LSPSPKPNLAKQPIQSDASYRMKLNYQEPVDEGGSVEGERKLGENME
jgi:hypothetical protein